MLGFGKSDIGKSRERNEDFYYVSNEPVGCLKNLYIIADGMGGHKAGDVASKFAVESFVEYVNGRSDTNEILDVLISGINYSNTVVHGMSENPGDYYNMGSTFIACTVSGDFAYVAHIGDSRVYKLSKGKFSQVTTDHSYVAEMVKAGKITPEEARNHPQRNVITRALGTDSNVISDGLIVPIRYGDMLLMCTDGLTGMLEDNEIESILKREDLNIEEKVNSLINSANEKGGYDNITVVLITIEGGENAHA